MWNDGALNFTQSTFGQGPTRAVTVTDLDADGARDVILTSNRGVLGYWHNEGGRTFRRRVLPGIANPAYALNWGDLDNDGDLDLVTASYDAGFLADIGNEYLLGNNGGVYVYANQAGTFHPTRLSNGAQALALASLLRFVSFWRPCLSWSLGAIKPAFLTAPLLAPRLSPG